MYIIQYYRIYHPKPNMEVSQLDVCTLTCSYPTMFVPRHVRTLLIPNGGLQTELNYFLLTCGGG